MGPSPPPKPAANFPETPERSLHPSKLKAPQRPPPPIPAPVPLRKTSRGSILSMATLSSAPRSPPRPLHSFPPALAETRAARAVPHAAPTREHPPPVSQPLLSGG